MGWMGEWLVEGANAEHVIKSFLATEAVKLIPSIPKLGLHSPGFIYLCCMLHGISHGHGTRSRTLEPVSCACGLDRV